MSLDKPAKLKDYLVVSTIGVNSLHQSYCKEGRNFDVMLIAYESEAFEKFKNDADLVVYKKGQKFELIHHYLTQKELKYKYYLLLDDDMLMTTEEINTFFLINEANQLRISHPSVIGYNHHKIMSPHVDYTLRFTDWIELQAVCFSRSKLNEMIDTFVETKHGWGLPELWWHKSITPWGEDFKLFAIVDEIKAIHTRDYGNTYQTDVAEREGVALLKKYGLKSAKVETLAKIYKGRYSVVIIYNEADQKFIPECIDSIPTEAEIVLVKTVPFNVNECFESGYLWNSKLTNVQKGSRHIMAEYHYRDDIGDGIINDFADARNKAKSLATKEWILSLDADERIIIAQHKLLNEVLETVGSNIGGFITGNVSNIEAAVDEKGQMYRHITTQVRLFRNLQGIDWQLNVHETVEFSLQKVGLKVKETPFCLFHEGYNTTPEGLYKKAQRNIKRLLLSPKELTRKPIYLELLSREMELKNKIETKGKNNGTESTVSGSKLHDNTSDSNKRIRSYSVHL